MKRILLFFTLLLSAVGWSYGQVRPLSGTVTDKAAVALEGVTVNVVGTKTTTMTDQNGQFRIEAASGQTLKFFYVGAEPVTFPVDANTMNAYFTTEKRRVAHLNDARFTRGRDEYFPIPLNQINFSSGLYKQNNGW